MFKDINGATDELTMVEVDDEDYDEESNINLGCYGAESIRGHIYNELIIEDLMKMINNKYTKDEINEYLSKNNIYKYTKKCFEIENLKELCGDEY